MRGGTIDNKLADALALYDGYRQSLSNSNLIDPEHAGVLVCDAIRNGDERLARYLAVENAYLSAFQTLGGLGLILGTLGLAAVLLRGVFERRGELALLQALGWRPFDLKLMVLAENSVLLLSGLAAGTLAAILAVAPHALSSVQPLPWVSLGLTLAVVFLVGTIAAWLALIAVIRAPLLPALRTE